MRPVTVDEALEAIGTGPFHYRLLGDLRPGLGGRRHAGAGDRLRRTLARRQLRPHHPAGDPGRHRLLPRHAGGCLGLRPARRPDRPPPGADPDRADRRRLRPGLGVRPRFRPAAGLAAADRHRRRRDAAGRLRHDGRVPAAPAPRPLAGGAGGLLGGRHHRRGAGRLGRQPLGRRPSLALAVRRHRPPRPDRLLAPPVAAGIAALPPAPRRGGAGARGARAHRPHQ